MHQQSDGRRTFIVKGPNYDSTIATLQSIIDKTFKNTLSTYQEHI